MRITDNYALPAAVPFLDVHLERDNWMFVEPNAIRSAAAAGDPYAVAADGVLTGYFDLLLDHVRAGRRGEGMQMLRHLHEPNETRLGMTEVGVAGHGVGDGIGKALWDQLATNPACQNAIVVRRIEELAPFVERVGVDLISDITTRVVFGVLADFTAAMVDRYPGLGRDLTTRREDLWDPARGQWVRRDVELPTPFGARLLLVPTNFAWPRQLFTPDSFYQVQSLGRIQDARTSYSREGRRLAPRKEDLRASNPAVRLTNIRQALDAAERDGVSLTERHGRYVQGRLGTMPRTSDDINGQL